MTRHDDTVVEDLPVLIDKLTAILDDIDMA